MRYKKSFWFLVIFFLLCLTVDLWAPYSSNEQNIDKVLEAPSWLHLMGTDDLGRDVLSRTFYASRLSFSLGFISSLLAVLIGFFYGIFSGWMGGRWDEILMRGVEFFSSLPTLVLLLLFKVILENMYEGQVNSYFILCITLSLIGWRTTARVMRGQVLQMKEMSFIESAKALGANNFRIIFFHLAPNLKSLLWALFIFQLPAHILFESFLSFIGLGFEPPEASLGVLMSDGWGHFYTGSFYVILFPAFLLFLIILALQTLSYNLRKSKQTILF